MSGVSAPKNAQKYYPAEDVKTPRKVRIVLLYSETRKAIWEDEGSAQMQWDISRDYGWLVVKAAAFAHTI